MTEYIIIFIGTSFNKRECIHLMYKATCENPVDVNNRIHRKYEELSEDSKYFEYLFNHTVCSYNMIINL